MKINLLSNKMNYLKSVALAAGLTLSACMSAPLPNKVKAYLEHRPTKEFLNFESDCYEKNYNRAQVQAKFDSLAYRDIFNATNAINDSNAVKEYNEIANKTIQLKDEDNIIRELENTDIPFKEYNRICKHKPGTCTSYKQYALDSILYRRFFEKHNLLDEPTLNRFNEISTEIKPDVVYYGNSYYTKDY